MTKIKKKVHFAFSQVLVSDPVLYRLSRGFDVEINVRAASVTEKGGFLVLELEGEESEVERVIEELRRRGSARPE